MTKHTQAPFVPVLEKDFEAALGALRTTLASPTLPPMSPKKTREQGSARLDPEVLEVVQHVAEAERRPVSNLVRNIVSD
jgi:hypothetical protein